MVVCGDLAQRKRFAILWLVCIALVLLMASRECDSFFSEERQQRTLPVLFARQTHTDGYDTRGTYPVVPSYVGSDMTMPLWMPTLGMSLKRFHRNILEVGQKGKF